MRERHEWADPVEQKSFSVTLLDGGRSNDVLGREILRLAERVRELEDARPLAAEPFDRVAADALADEVAALVMRKVLDARSPVADALLDYRGTPRTERSDRIAELEAEVVRIAEHHKVWRAKAEAANALEAERDEIDQILLEANLPLDSADPLPDRVRSAILYAQAGNEYGVAALKLRIEELEREVFDLTARENLEIATLRRQLGEAAATLREALDEQGRLRLENRRLREGERQRCAQLIRDMRFPLTPDSFPDLIDAIMKRDMFGDPLPE